MNFISNKNSYLDGIKEKIFREISHLKLSIYLESFSYLSLKSHFLFFNFYSLSLIPGYLNFRAVDIECEIMVFVVDRLKFYNLILDASSHLILSVTLVCIRFFHFTKGKTRKKRR